MSVVEGLSRALSEVKSALDIATKLQEADFIPDKAEIKFQIAGMLDSLAYAKMQINEAKDVMAYKNGEIKKLLKIVKC